MGVNQLQNMSKQAPSFHAVVDRDEMMVEPAMKSGAILTPPDDPSVT
jgi:hypothetical protein